MLPNGLDAKSAVDAAVERCAAIGDLRADIHACKQAAEGGGGGGGKAEAGEWGVLHGAEKYSASP